MTAEEMNAECLRFSAGFLNGAEIAAGRLFDLDEVKHLPLDARERLSKLAIQAQCSIAMLRGYLVSTCINPNTYQPRFLRGNSP